MAIEAGSHGVPYGQHCHRPLANIPVARGATNIHAVMRRVAELDQRLRAESVNPLPGDFHPTGRILAHLLHIRLGDCQLLMAKHALSYGWNARLGLLVAGRVTVQASQTQGHVPVVGKRDRLLTQPGRGAKTQRNKPLAIYEHVSLRVLQDTMAAIEQKAGKGAELTARSCLPKRAPVLQDRRHLDGAAWVGRSTVAAARS
jgi:hypothetical protein